VTEYLPAFPQAEGFGAYSLGGRGGKVIFVDNLNDDGPGSLRAAVMDPDPRIVIFRVSGTIELQSSLVVKHPFITIAGHTAPGDGICLKNFPLSVLRTNDVIVRGIRVRTGIEYLQPGKSSDGISVNFSEKVILDHCTAGWSTDEIMDNRSNSDITVQWCIFSESLNNSVHRKGEHGYAATIGGVRSSYHHNLFAHNKGRNPSIGGDDENRTEQMDFRNNVVYNWETRVCDGKPRTMNFVGNYYKPGPATRGSNRRRMVEVQPSEEYGYTSLWYINDNLLVGHPELTGDNWSGAVTYKEGCSMEKNRSYTPFGNTNYMTRDAGQAYFEVLDHAGVTVPRRDAVEKRVVGEVRTGTATFGKGIIDRVDQVGAWPELRTYDVPVDADSDGMPDEWEFSEGLDPVDPSDRTGVKEGEVYDNLERYLNQLASDRPFLLPPIKLKVSQDDNSGVLLEWADISDGEQGFVVQRTDAGGNFHTLDMVGAGVTEYTDTHPESIGTAEYRVFAYDGERTSLASKPAGLNQSKI
jgi:hypothetical protein